MEHNETRSSSSTVSKALDILFYLRDARTPLGVSAIARALGLQKSGAPPVDEISGSAQSDRAGE